MRQNDKMDFLHFITKWGSTPMFLFFSKCSSRKLRGNDPIWLARLYFLRRNGWGQTITSKKFRPAGRCPWSMNGKPMIRKLPFFPLFPIGIHRTGIFAYIYNTFIIKSYQMSWICIYIHIIHGPNGFWCEMLYIYSYIIYYLPMVCFFFPGKHQWTELQLHCLCHEFYLELILPIDMVYM